MSKFWIIIWFIGYSITTSAAIHFSAIPKDTTIYVTEYVDTTPLRDQASMALRALKKGSVIVRLKTNQKSVDAYRKAGRPEVAIRIEKERKAQNEKLYAAFIDNFLFCKVYFIYAHETNLFKAGKKVLLNENLDHDTTLIFTDSNYVFCEFGSVEAFSNFKEIEHPANKANTQNTPQFSFLDSTVVKTSTSPATTSGLVFLDKELNQFHRPFPFVEGVYMENYNGPVRALNQEMERAYYRLVERKDFKEKMKVEKKKQRILQKELMNKYK